MAHPRRGGPGGETACEQIKIRVTPTERRRLERAAAALGTTVYALVRSAALALVTLDGRSVVPGEER